MTIRVAVTGATGKLGSIIVRLVEAADDLELQAALHSGSSLDELAGADVVVDATSPAVSREIVESAIRRGMKVVVGTSGWSAERVQALEPLVAAHPGAAVIVVPNFSLGSALGTALATVAARFFDSIEIIETHGESKVDSPSGTAVRTAELIAASRGADGPVSAPHTDQRARGQQVASVPVHSLRMRGVVARQRVIFGGAGETLAIEHDTVNPTAYEAGILLAVRAAHEATGITVGLDKLIDLGIPAPSTPSVPRVRDTGEGGGDSQL